MAHYERAGHERDPVYDIARIKAELGFVPARSVLPRLSTIGAGRDLPLATPARTVDFCWSQGLPNGRPPA